MKVSYVKAFAPANTREVYRVTERSLAPGSWRVVHYALRAEDVSLKEGQQTGSRINALLVRTPLQVSGVDRRYLQPLPADGAAPRLARRYPGTRFAFSMLDGTRERNSSADEGHDEDDLYGDVQSAVS